MEKTVCDWENATKKRKRKYYLVMFLREACKIHTELPVSVKVNFPNFVTLSKKCVATETIPCGSM